MVMTMTMKMSDDDNDGDDDDDDDDYHSHGSHDVFGGIKSSNNLMKGRVTISKTRHTIHTHTHTHTLTNCSKIANCHSTSST